MATIYPMEDRMFWDEFERRYASSATVRALIEGIESGGGSRSAWDNPYVKLLAQEGAVIAKAILEERREVTSASD